MASIFITGNVPAQSPEQKKISRLSWKPNSARRKMQESGPVITIVAGPMAAAKEARKKQQRADHEARKPGKHCSS